MANVKISQLTATAAAVGTQEFEINDSGTSKKVTGTQIKTFVNSDRVAKTSDTGSAVVPSGAQSLRDGTPSAGYFRFNTDVSKFEGYNGTAWGSVGGGATGGGTDEVFIENGQTVTSNYTITTNKNALTAGPITVNSGVTVTIPSGSVWTIV
jgi:hypothetical protein